MTTSGEMTFTDDSYNGTMKTDTPQGAMTMKIAGKRLGLVGYGSIARETAKRAAALDMAVTAFDPFVESAHPAWRPTRPSSSPTRAASRRRRPRSASAASPSATRPSGA